MMDPAAHTSKMAGGQRDIMPGEREDSFERPPDTHAPPIVGIGAAGGGVQPLHDVFMRMPGDTGMAFVVVLYGPEQDRAAQMLERATSMPVMQVAGRATVEANHVYLVAANKHFAIEDSTLLLADLDRPFGRIAVDLFFRQLAESQGRDATAVVLSGAGSDGTLGLARVKERGGLTIAQDPDEAEYDSMPRSAIVSGMVDYVLPAAQIPAQILAYRRNGSRVRVSADPAQSDADALRDIFVLLRIRTGHDFSSYKRSTILRRIGRRMQIMGVNDLTDYLLRLRDHPGEVQALLRDLLISVTNFFRDPVAFGALAELVPRLFAGKQISDQVRVWSAGCATGEEAYSIAMLLREYSAQLQDPPAIQIFATDIDEEAITYARDGIYPENIVADVSPERLRRFFVAEQGGYRVRKEIRDTILFAIHNVLRDPPFLRLDLVTCRNLLIYLDRAMQERVLELFHFVLRPDGLLLLGSSETAESLPRLFTVVDKMNRIYARRDGAQVLPALPVPPSANLARRPQSPGEMPNTNLPATPIEVHLQLLEEYAPPSLIVNDAYEIVHLSKHVGRFLQFSGGAPSHHLLTAVHPDLRLELRSALFQAAQSGRPTNAQHVQVQLDGQTQLVNIGVRPARTTNDARGFLLVIFEEAGAASAEEAQAISEDREPFVRQLEMELERMREQLRSTVEQYETSNEELKASNEELQSMNEELRSAAEELETSKEELQSVNEELTTVNQELKNKVDEISRINSDLQNLMASTEIGTIFLDRELRIKRYTPRVQELFNLIPTDVNRPLAHITHQLRNDGLLDDAQRVIEQLTPLDRELQHGDGRWFLARLVPYRTVDDRIDGVVLTFVDITERRRAEEALRANQQLLSNILDQMPVGVLIADRSGRIVSGNQQVERIFGRPYPRAQTVEEYRQWQLYTVDGRPYPPEELPLARSLQHGEMITGEEMRFQRPDGIWCVLGVGSAPIRDEQGTIISAVMTLEEITARKQAEADLRESQEALRAARDELEARVVERTAELEEALEAVQVEVAQRRQLESARQELLRELVTAQEEERRRISRELHDQLSQQITALRLGMEALKESSYQRELALAQLDELQQIVDSIGHEMRRMALGLRPTTLDDLGLDSALAAYVDDWAERTGIPVAYFANGLGQLRLPREVETTIYRVVLEALANVLKHAGATGVSVLLEYRDGDAVAIVEDNGRGFDVESVLRSADAKQRLGILGMQERVAIVGGQLTIESTPGTGTTVHARIPVAPSALENPEASNLDS